MSETAMVGSPETPLEPAKTETAIPAVNPPAAEEKALYTGLTGDLKTLEDLKKYASQLETMVVAKREHTIAQAPTFLPAQLPKATLVAPTESFEDLIYSNPTKAKQVLESEIMQKLDMQQQQKARQENFWQNFYVQNSDLKELKHIVQSVFKRDNAEIVDPRSKFRSDEELGQHLAKEARSIIGLVREKSGTETRLDSNPAVTMSSSGGEQVPAPRSVPGQPLNFTDQLAAMKNKRRKA